ncbi:hypothetical protein [Haloarchaeobius iranensis]|uniref:Uncharacterized protein n=1 Tax=Haloarchaeobius iranensis TaxID=996166 RepID=A0A1G9ZXD7_9EURY|nr:hypothetical protein [Haloarchaeobius iranensis]SDN25754.1 hypothetical protein SAMN05192554_12317 [Haloarchaeobius iranensis]
MDEADGASDDTMRSRAQESSWKLRLLLDANRWLVAAGILTFVFLGTLAAGLAVDGVARLTAGDPVETLFQAHVTAIVTGVTLVLTLNQLVLSQELGPAGDQRERMAGATTFREDVADVVGVPVAPADPAAFLKAMLDAADERAADLAESAAADGEAVGHIESLTDAVQTNAAVSDELSGTEFGDFDVVAAALDFNYSWKLYAAKRLRAEHGEELSDDAAATLDELVDLLSLFGPAREHVKTLYFQWELVDLSRAISYTAVPALLVAIAMLSFFDPTSPAFAGSTFGVAHVLLVYALASTLSVAPFAILLAYVLRVATVAKRTLSIGPFILRDTDRSFDYDDD